MDQNFNVTPHKLLPYFLTFLLFVHVSNASAQALETQNWPEWNASSSPLFPGITWAKYETPEEAGWSSEKLQQAKQWFSEAESAAVVIVFNGAVLAQWGQTKRRFMCHSVRKSLLSALYGIAVEEGSIALNETIISIGIDDNDPLTESEKSATVSDLLKSRSGIYHQATYWEAENLPERGSHRPGTHYYYNNWDFNALGTIYNKKTSTDLFEAFEATIAKPIQMQDFELRHTYYHLEPEISRHPAYPFRMSARDLARFGLLFLNEGRWKDQQLIPSSWVNESTRSHSTLSSRGFGYMWAIPRKIEQLGKLNTYWAAGYGGHKVYVVPGARLVLVHRADTYTDKFVNDIYPEKILMEVLNSRTGPPNPTPKLVELDDKTVKTQGSGFPKEQIPLLTGKYYSADNSVVIEESEDHLQITNPYSGKFYLTPLSSTEFEVEDEQYRGEFVYDDTGIAVTIRIWTNSNEPDEYHRSYFEGHEK